MNLCCHAMHTCTPRVPSGTAKQTLTQCSQRAVNEGWKEEKKAAPSPYLLCGGQCVWQPHLGEKNLKYYSGVNLHRNTSASLLLTCWCLVTSSRGLFWWLQKAQIRLQIFPRGVRVKMKKIGGFLALFPLSLLLLPLLNFAGLALKVWEYFFPLKWN